MATSTLAVTVQLASAHMPGEYHPPGAEHGQLERFIEWLPWSSLGRMPPADGARWYADPQTVSNVFLAIIAVLMVFQHVDFFLHFRERRFGPLVRESPLHLRRRSRALLRRLRRRVADVLYYSSELRPLWRRPSPLYIQKPGACSIRIVTVRRPVTVT